jgi:chitinase
LNRDRPCSENRSDRVSNLCSGEEQAEMEFSAIFAGAPGAMTDAAAVVTDSLNEPLIDDPARSPYPIWEEGKGYAKGKKVVWRREVYEAKWWTEGQQPDAPVTNEWETPWRYVGPVLADEVAPTLTTLPAGSHPEWRPDAVYDKGDMVLLDGMPYRAKWWTQGTPPDIEVQSEFDSPWEPLGLPDGW